MGNPKEEKKNVYSNTRPNTNSVFTLSSLLLGGIL